VRKKIRGIKAEKDQLIKIKALCMLKLVSDKDKVKKLPSKLFNKD